MSLRALAPLALLAAAAVPACANAQRAAPQGQATLDAVPPNVLSSDELAAGFRLLFEGTSTNGWRGYHMATMPEGWRVVDGALTRVGSTRDILTVDQFANFELRLQWRVAPRGNSGILYRVTEEGQYSYYSGPELQVLDDAGHPDGQSRLTSAGSDYGLYAAPAGVVRPAGEWNDVRLVVNGAHVEHWLNGVKVVEYELWSDEWRRLVDASKFMQWPIYGMARRGHIALQDHGDTVAYRTIRIRELP